MKLQGKVAIVTGGARGIGRQIATLFHREGARVFIADVLEQGEQTANDIGEGVTFLRTDVAKEEQVQAMVAACVETFGRLDVLVNNAGAGRRGPTTELKAEDWYHVIDVCLSATFFGAKYAAPELVKAGGGSLISMASVHGIQAAAGWAPYEAAKGGLISLVRALAAEFGPHGIRVNSISPGWIITPELEGRFSPEILSIYSQNYVLRRPGRALEVAQAALFLASDEASFITGHNLVVDGGMTTWLSEDQMAHFTGVFKSRPKP